MKSIPVNSRVDMGEVGMMKKTRTQAFIFFCIVVLLSLSFSWGKERYRWTLYNQEPLGKQEVHMVHLDSVGNRWFGTEKGLVVLTDSENWEMHSFESTNGKLFSDSILCMGVDEFGDVWLGTTRGISVYSNGFWSSYTHENTQGGLPDNHVLSLSIDPSGSKWVGTQKGFAKLENNLWTSYPAQKILGKVPQVAIQAIETDREGGVWLGTAEGAVHFDGIVYTLHTKENTENKLPDNYITSIKKDSEGNVWVGTHKGLGKFLDEEWSSITPRSVRSFPGELVYRIVLGNKSQGEDNSEDVLVCIRGGLAYLSGGEWKSITKNNSDAALLSRRVYGVLAEGNKELWIATRDGVSRRSKILK